MMDIHTNSTHTCDPKQPKTGQGKAGEGKAEQHRSDYVRLRDTARGHNLSPMFRRRKAKAPSCSSFAAAAPSAAPAGAAGSCPTSRASSASSSSISSSSLSPTTAATAAAAATDPLTALALPPASEWPQFPVYVRFSPRPLPAATPHSSTPRPPPPPSATAGVDPPQPPPPQQQRRDGRPQASHVPFNTLQRIPFDTPLFEGEIVLNLAGLSPPPASFDTRGRGYFTGCGDGRTLECAVQGRFKRRLRFDEAYTGQSFSAPLQRLPPRIVLKAIEAIVRRLAPATQLSVTGDQPFILGPLATIAAVMRVFDPSKGDGAVPDIMTLEEDTAALGGAFTPPQPHPQQHQSHAHPHTRRRRSREYGGGGGGGWLGRGRSSSSSSSGEGGGPLPLHKDRMARRRFFADASKLRAFHFEPGLVYGFGFFGSAWRVDTWQLSVANLASIDLASYVHASQALQIMARLKERDELLWALELWHAKTLLSSDAYAAAAGTAYTHPSPPPAAPATAAAAAAAEEERGAAEAEHDDDDFVSCVDAGLQALHMHEEEEEQQEKEKPKPFQRLAALLSPRKKGAL